jgi:predicted Zn-dependent protease
MRRLQHEFEIEADALGAKVMAAAGFDPQALADYLRRSGVDESRLAGLSQAIQRLAAPANSPAGRDFFRLQDEVRAAFPARARSK